jgi:hygromycin-B 4-O-kinase
MSEIKTKVDNSTIDKFFERHDQASRESLQEIGHGEISQAYFFEEQGATKVLRINAHTDKGFKKDQYAYENFSGPNIPIPKIEEIGEISEGVYYAVSEKSPGKTLVTMSHEEYLQIVPSLMQTLDEIHHLQPIGEGFGSIQPDGNAPHATWKDFLKHHRPEGDWLEKLKTIDFFDADLIQAGWHKAEQMHKYLPDNVRQVIHSDYGFDNALGEGNQITGVIDWNDCKYGDPLVDVARLDLWQSMYGPERQINFAELFKQRYTADNRLPENYDERILCYKIISCVGGMTFFAEANLPVKYAATQTVLQNLLTQANQVT